MKKFFYLTFCFILIVNASIFSQKITFEGYGATGFRWYDRNILNSYNQEVYYEGKFQTNIEISDEIESQLDFRANSLDNRVTMKEFSVRFVYFDFLKFKVGQVKKPFGNEQLTNREKLYTIERSMVHDNISELGYGGRSIMMMGYYKYSKKRPEFPYSYYLSVFRNNALFTGVSARFAYHFSDFSLGGNYLFQHKGGEIKTSTQGAALDLTYDKKQLFSSIEIAYIEDPYEESRRIVLNLDDDVYGTGFKIISAYKFSTGGEIIKNIEPVLLVSYYIPDLDISASNLIQTLVGINFYFHKKVKLRLNGDLRLTKNQFNEEYSTRESRIIVDLQVRF